MRFAKLGVPFVSSGPKKRTLTLSISPFEFAKLLHYEIDKSAVLSEDETVYGGSPIETQDDVIQSDSAATGHDAGPSLKNNLKQASECDVPNSSTKDPASDGVVQLHFPREISYLRTALQKVTQAQQPISKTQEQSRLPLDLNETGNDDDTVAPYAPLQTPLSQEAEMIGIVNELHMHHIKFTLVLATDPLDQLFLVRYLRQAYPQGRLVITTPDLLLNRQDDSLLHGVMALTNYPLIPGLGDRLISPVTHDNAVQYDCKLDIPHRTQLDDVHDDRVFVSSSSVGTFNAMVGLLSVGSNTKQDDLLPGAPYSLYGPPIAAFNLKTDRTWWASSHYCG